MKLVVESGATKSTWVLIEQNQIVDTQVLDGINPTSNPISVNYVHQYENNIGKVKHIYFYGAGVSNQAAKSILEHALKEKFDGSKIFLGHDILAAALSVSYGKPSIVSILGTGTNTVIFDGYKIIESFKAMGYMFADYGSGFHVGKILIQRYYRKEMSESDYHQFQETYIDGQDDLLFRIYKAQKPNYVTAKMSYFLSSCTDQLRNEVMNEAFGDFFKYQIEPIKNAKNYKLNFVGSISKVFEEELRRNAKQRGYVIDKIEGNPIDGLIDYHNKMST